MVHKTRVAAAAALAIMALTGCGKATTEATPSHLYSPLPSFSTATPTPTKSPAPEASPRPSPTPSPTSTSAPSDGSMAAPQAGMSVAGAEAPAQEAPAGAPAPAPAVAPAPVPAPAPAPAGGGTPVQGTEFVSSTTTTVTTRTLAASVLIVVTCEGRCDLSDVQASELTGENGPISLEALAEELERRGGGQQVTEELASSLTKADWELAEQHLEGGQERLVFASRRK